MMLVLAAAIIWLGVAPQPVLNIAAPALAGLTPPTTAMLKNAGPG
jgi:NADH:ubiquinone oxidoreductase subunit 4 (subunit M)